MHLVVFGSTSPSSLQKTIAEPEKHTMYNVQCTFLTSSLLFLLKGINKMPRVSFLSSYLGPAPHPLPSAERIGSSIRDTEGRRGRGSTGGGGRLGLFLHSIYTLFSLPGGCSSNPADRGKGCGAKKTTEKTGCLFHYFPFSLLCSLEERLNNQNMLNSQ